MKKDLINRERRLRRQAEAKGLRIQKQTKGTNTGYLIVTTDTQAVIAGYGYYRNLLPIDEAEQFVEAY